MPHRRVSFEALMYAPLPPATSVTIAQIPQALAQGCTERWW